MRQFRPRCADRSSASLKISSSTRYQTLLTKADFAPGKSSARYQAYPLPTPTRFTRPPFPPYRSACISLFVNQKIGTMFVVASGYTPPHILKGFAPKLWILLMRAYFPCVLAFTHIYSCIFYGKMITQTFFAISERLARGVDDIST